MTTRSTAFSVATFKEGVVRKNNRCFRIASAVAVRGAKVVALL